jgi:MYXO-CTERM domain-containing protein
MRASPALSSLVLAAALTATAGASAHTLLVNPEPLIGEDDAKTGPCGCTFDGTGLACPDDYPVLEVEAGSEMMVSWDETIDHTGNFRIAFAAVTPEAATVADFDDAALQMTVDDTLAGGLFSQAFTLPDVPCELCTIQVRQFMEGAEEPYYFTCGAIRIVEQTGQGGGTPTGGSTSAATTTTSAGPATTAAGGTNPSGGGAEAEWQPEPEEGGCSSSGKSGTETGLALLGLAGLVLAARARRRR